MNINKLFNYVRYIASNKLLVISILAVLIGGSVALSTLINFNQANASLPRDCYNNSIIYCGAITTDEFVDKYNQNSTGDLANIYAAFGLTSDELPRFQQTAKLATIYKDGRVVVDGRVVAHDARSLGRHDVPGSTAMVIGGKTYYLRPNTLSFDADSIQGYVMLNGDTVEFIALTSCGNPVTATQPKHSCDMLNSQKIDDNTYKFSSNVTAANGATLTKVVYDFGDGTTVEKTNPSDQITHVYKPGDYTAKVTAYFSYYGQTFADTSTKCTTQITVPQPPPTPVYAYECSLLTARKITRTRYEFTATTAYSDNVTLQDVDFTFGDDQDAKGVKSTDKTTAITDHEYATAGDYTITAAANFNVAGGIKSVNCTTAITIDKEETPKIPETPITPETPETPVVLPTTGAGENIASFLGIGSLITSGGYYLKSRRR